MGAGKERGDKPDLASRLHQTVPTSPQCSIHAGAPRDTVLSDKQLVSKANIKFYTTIFSSKVKQHQNNYENIQEVAEERISSVGHTEQKHLQLL